MTSIQRLPVVFTRDEVQAILARLDEVLWIMGRLLYGSGLRLMECLRLRIRDIDFKYGQITVREGKDQKDRYTMLPVSVSDPLEKHLERVRLIHMKDLENGYGRVNLSCSAL